MDICGPHEWGIAGMDSPRCKDRVRKPLDVKEATDIEDRLPGAIRTILAAKHKQGAMTREEETIWYLVGARLTITELVASKKEEIEGVI